jgi:hypothetical protein
LVDITQLVRDMLRGMTGIVKSSLANGCRRCARPKSGQWLLQDAKARFGELVRRAVARGRST